MVNASPGLLVCAIRFYGKSLLGYRVIQIAIIKRMAAPNAFGGHPAAPKEAVFLNCFIPVMRAGGFKPATRRRHGRDELLVKANHAERNIFHDGTSPSGGAACQRRARCSA